MSCPLVEKSCSAYSPPLSMRRPSALVSLCRCPSFLSLSSVTPYLFSTFPALLAASSPSCTANEGASASGLRKAGQRRVPGAGGLKAPGATCPLKAPSCHFPSLSLPQTASHRVRHLPPSSSFLCPNPSANPHSLSKRAVLSCTRYFTINYWPTKPPLALKMIFVKQNS